VKNNQVPASSFPVVLPPGRSTTGGNTTARPDPEVVAQAKRRRFTAEYKQQILSAADQAKGTGGIGALLRREGLYSSLLATWRRERDAGVLQALAPQKRGPKSKRDPFAEENLRLRRETERLIEELRKAEIVIDIQKKVATLLGRPIPAGEPEEKP
jgi:transposase